MLHMNSVEEHLLFIDETADEQLFVKIIKNKEHLLGSVQPPQHEQHYKRSDRVHNFQRPARTSSAIGSNFIVRMLYKNSDAHCDQLLVHLYFIPFYFPSYCTDCYLAAFCLLF